MTTDRHSISPYPLRLPPELRARLETAAAESGRSLHAELVSRLDESFKPQGPSHAELDLRYKAFLLESDITHRTVDEIEVLNLIEGMAQEIPPRVLDEYPTFKFAFTHLRRFAQRFLRTPEEDEQRLKEIKRGLDMTIEALGAASRKRESRTDQDTSDNA